MENGVTLYDYKTDGLQVRVVARFEKDDLVIDGYDIGQVVEDLQGDYDYEYTITVKKHDVGSLSKALDIDSTDHAALLHALADRFSGNHCFSALTDFLSKHKIPFERFSWT